MNLMTVKEAARTLGISQYTLRVRVESGEIRCVQVGRRWMVDLDEVKTYFFSAPTGATVDDVAEYTGMSKHQVYEAIAGGWFRARKIGRAYILDLEQVEQAVRERMGAHYED